MSRRATIATARRILAQLRGDPRTIALIMIVPLVLLLLSGRALMAVAQSFEDIDTVNIGEVNAAQLGIPAWMLYVVDPAQPLQPLSHARVAHPNTFIGSFTLDLFVDPQRPPWRYVFWMDSTRAIMRVNGKSSDELMYMVDMADSCVVVARGGNGDPGKFTIGLYDRALPMAPNEPAPLPGTDTLLSYPCTAHYRFLGTDTLRAWTTTALPNAFLDAYHWAPMDGDHAFAVFRLLKDWGVGMPMRLILHGDHLADMIEVHPSAQPMPQADLSTYWVRDRRPPDHRGPLLRRH